MMLIEMMINHDRLLEIEKVNDMYIMTTPQSKTLVDINTISGLIKMTIKLNNNLQTNANIYMPQYINKNIEPLAVKLFKQLDDVHYNDSNEIRIYNAVINEIPSKLADQMHDQMADEYTKYYWSITM